MSRQFIILFLSFMFDSASYAVECRDETNLSLISIYKEISKNAERMAAEFVSIRGEIDLSKKINLFLSKITPLNAVLTSHKGRFNALKVLANFNKLGDEQKADYEKATEVEAKRVQDAISSSRKLLDDKKFDRKKINDLEFSINGLLEVFISRLRDTAKTAEEDADYQFKYCLYEQKELPLATDLSSRFKLGIVDFTLFGGIINPLRAGFASGKYSMSITRIEMLNQSSSNQKDSSKLKLDDLIRSSR